MQPLADSHVGDREPCLLLLVLGKVRNFINAVFTSWCPLLDVMMMMVILLMMMSFVMLDLVNMRCA